MILLVEDNPDDVTLTVRALKKNNISNPVAIATDGEAALLWIRNEEQHPLPSLILLDLNLPKVAGLDVLREIRSNPRTKFLPVVVLTTSSEERDIVESYQLGANSFVRKPVVFAEFVEAVRALGVYWLLVNQGVPRSNG